MHNIKTMKNWLLILLTFFMSSCSAQDKKDDKNLVVTYSKDGKLIKDTIAIKDTFLLNELNNMMTDPNYKPTTLKNDTTFNQQRQPILVKLGDDIFGASVQRFEYDSLNRLINIIGYNNKGTIKPFYQDIAIEIYKYDYNGNKIETRYFGENRKPIRSEVVGPAIIKYVYNGDNQMTEQWFLDEDEKPLSDFAKITYRYNEQGKLISEEHFDGNGKKIK